MIVPFVVWLAPFTLYVAVTLFRRVPSARSCNQLIGAALVGNILLLIGYALVLTALEQLQRARFMAEAERCMREHLAEACPGGGYPFFDPPPPPLHWEWAMVGYVLASAGLYFLLHVLEQRMARREADAAIRSGHDTPGG